MVDRIINYHADYDPQLYTTVASNNTNLKTNYAPMRTMLSDTMRTRNKHPLARYTQPIPIYPNMLSNEEPIISVAQKQSELNRDRILKSLDIVGMSSANKAPKYDNSIVAPDKLPTHLTKEEQAMNYLNPQQDFLFQTQRNKTFLNNLVYNRTGKKLLADRHDRMLSNAELQNSYPYTVTGVSKVPSSIEAYKPTSTSHCVKFTGVPDLPERFLRHNSSHVEPFTRDNADDTYLDQVYIQSLEARLAAVINYIRNNNTYDPWKKNWDVLAKAVQNRSFSFSRLEESDSDIAYTVNKGEKTKFRIRGENKRYVPLNIYQYVMLHEAAHCANYGSWGHGEDFKELLALLCLAAYEIGLINLRNISKEIYLTNGQPILCQADIKEEIYSGIKHMQKAHPNMYDHYSMLEDHIRSQ